MQSLSADRYRLARIALILGILVVLAMLTWFFRARVGVYETSTAVELTEDNRLLAEFPPQSLPLIQPGQAGTLRIFPAAGGEPINAPVEVYGLDESSGKVELMLTGDPGSIPIPSGQLEGKVMVQVTQMTPVEMVLQAYESSSQPASPVNGGAP
jgi:hypothetical protein